MVSLDRKAGDAIRIGDDIVIRVLDVKGGTVRLGIEAPFHVNVVRSELILRDRGGQPPQKEVSTVRLKDESGSRKVLVTYLRRKKMSPP